MLPSPCFIPLKCLRSMVHARQNAVQESQFYSIRSKSYFTGVNRVMLFEVTKKDLISCDTFFFWDY